MRDLIKTDRLTLRRPTLSDAPAMTEVANSMAVARMLARLPHPYSLDDAQGFLPKASEWWQAGTGYVFAITMHDGTFMGVIGIEQMTGRHRPGCIQWETGYWLGEAWWGQGFATEALTAVMEAFEDARPNETVMAGYMSENTASGRVLEKASFVPAPGSATIYSLARGHEVPHTTVRRMPARALRAQIDAGIETERLMVRRPQPADMPGMIPLISDFDVAKMTASIPHPYAPEMADAWLARSANGDRSGHHFMLAAIEKATGAYVGTIGLHYTDGHPGPQPDSWVESWELGYWIGKPYWGRGLATEGAGAVIAAFSRAWPDRHIAARYFTENPQSGRVLEKIGFYDTGIESPGVSIARGSDFRGPTRHMLRPPPEEARP
jgi:RimJ/RimL family protein N-acetyltransferase